MSRLLIPSPPVGSRPFVLWSAGKDSTYLVYDRLRRGCKVTAAYVEVTNNSNKVATEKRAISELSKRFEAEFPGQLTVIYPTILSINSGHGLLLAQPLLWLFSAAYAASSSDDDVGRCPDEVSLSYIIGDCAISWLDDLRSIWKGFSNLAANLPPLTFPLTKVGKDEINALLPKHLASLCVFCRLPSSELPG